MRLANQALPEDRDDTGSCCTPAMRSPDVFVVLFEYGPEIAVGSAHCSVAGVPLVTADMFGSKRLNARSPASWAAQHFFQHADRFCSLRRRRGTLHRGSSPGETVLTDLDINAVTMTEASPESHPPRVGDRGSTVVQLSDRGGPDGRNE